MKRFLGIGIAFFCFAALGGIARAEYKTPSREAVASGGSFDEAVDPSRFRKGNLAWDTQELIASGLKALHEEQVRILDRLDRIQSRLDQLENKIGNLSERK